ncbi:MAG: hypothetical protein N2749_00900 [Clostridia bacterium]|nr:hypothetical protein [Clostridia bacterium]
MNENESIIEKLIMRVYIEMLRKDNIVPSVNNIVKTAKLIAEKEAYDFIYGPDIISKIEPQTVHQVLSAHKCAHGYFGTVCYEAQILLFDNWYDFQILLKE